MWNITGPNLYKTARTNTVPFIHSLTLIALSGLAPTVLFAPYHFAQGTVAGPEYCVSGTYFDETLEDCLFLDGSGNNPDGTFCGLEGCYSPGRELLGLSPHHPAAEEECGPDKVYDWRTDACVRSNYTFHNESNIVLDYPNDTAYPPMDSQVDWFGICSSLEPALLSSCTSLVSANGTLTYEGNRAVGCIRNGALLAAAAGLNAIPLDWIIGGLQALEGPTGCSGIVNWEMLNQIGGTDTILDLTQ